MDTPGDKKDLDRIAPGTSTSFSSFSDSESELPLLAPSEVSSVLQQSTAGTSEGTSEEMGVISHLPVPFLSASLPPLSTKPEIFQQQNLEQPTLEDYYGQSKYYETLYPPVAQQQTFQDLSEPGPSGFQTPKSKSAPPPRMKKKKIEQKRTHLCPQCHKTFSTGEKLHRHYKNHQESSRGSPFKCDQCKKTFTSKFKLVRHALIHSDKKPFSCSVCERTFHRKDHLKNHIKVHSPTKKLYECDTCKKQYTSLLSFRKHQAVHAAEDGNLTCQICSETFENKGQILYHLKVHAGSRTIKNPSEKKYLCDFCDRRFFTRKDVKRHLVVHTGMRDFLCQFCPQRFGRKDHLVRHIKKSHNRDYTEQGISQESTSQGPPTKSQKPETITSGALSRSPSFKDDSNDDVFEEAPTSSAVIKEEPLQMKSELDLEGVKTIFEEENVSPLEEEDIYRSEQSTQSDLKELLITDIFKKIEKPPVQRSVLLSSEPIPSTTIRHLPQKSSKDVVLSAREHELAPRLYVWHRPMEGSPLPSPDVMTHISELDLISQESAPSKVSTTLPLVPTSIDRPSVFSQSRRISGEQPLPSLVPFHDPSEPLSPLAARPVQEPDWPVSDPSISLPPLRIRPRAMPPALARPQQPEEEKKPLPGFSQTFQPPPPS